MTKNKLFILLAILLTISYGKVPSWFKKLPKTPKGVYVEVGYSTVYNNPKLGRDLAIYRAAKNLAKQIQIELKFELSTRSDGIFSLGIPDFEEIYEQDILFDIINNHIIIDSIFTKKKSYYLIQYPATPKIKINRKKVKWGEKPKWINTTPESNKYVYGIGQIARYINTTRAWTDTDSFARFAAGKNICVTVGHVRNEKRTDNYSTLDIHTSQFYDIMMYDCTIIKRWYDKKRDAYYSLCRTRKNSSVVK